MTEQELYDMPPLVWKELSKSTLIMRVPGGWLTRSRETWSSAHGGVAIGLAMAFIPYNSDLQREINR